MTSNLEPEILTGDALVWQRIKSLVILPLMTAVQVPISLLISRRFALFLGILPRRNFDDIVGKVVRGRTKYGVHVGDSETG